MSFVLTSDGCSFHTAELKNFPSLIEYRDQVAHLYKLAHQKKKNFMYQISAKNPETHFCKRFQKEGIKLYFSKTEDPHATVKAVVNPRKLIDPESSYLGILPPNDNSVAEFSERFTDCMLEINLVEHLSVSSGIRTGLRMKTRMRVRLKILRGLCRKSSIRVQT